MSLSHLPGYKESALAVEANLSSRAKRMADFEAYVACTQYEGLPDWFSDAKPLWERAPCVVEPVVKNAILSNRDLLLGESRFPIATCEDADDVDDADDIERALATVAKKSRLRMAAREVFASAQGAGSAAALYGIRANRLFIDTVRGRWCTPEFDGEGAVRRLVIEYPYILEVHGARGDKRVEAYLFRREIDDTTDTTFLPAIARPDGIAPQWQVDKSKTVKHGLGFCPAVWYPHMRGCAIVDDFDGEPIHAMLTDEVRAHDFSRSQKHRAALFTGDPQWTEVGVEPGYNPTEPGRQAEVPTTLHGGAVSEGNPIRGGFSSAPRGKRARKKGPGTVWQYPEGVEVKQHSLPGDALDAIDKHGRDLRMVLAHGLGVVFLDPETMPTATSISGRALELLKSRQLDRVDDYRTDFGDRFLLPSWGMLLRIAIAKKLPLRGLDAVERLIGESGSRWSWHTPPFELSWGRYFRPDSLDENQQVELAVKARDGGIATTRAAVEKVRAVFDIKNVSQFVEELEAEESGKLKAQQALARQMMQDNGDESDQGDGTDDDNGDDVQDEDGSDEQPSDGGKSGAKARRKRRTRSRAA